MSGQATQAAPGAQVRVQPGTTALKRVEYAGKRLAALLLSWVLWRWGRAARAREALRRRQRVLLVRIDNRVGEALLLTPVVDALRNLEAAPRIDVLVHPRCARVLEGLPGIHALIPFDRRDFATLRRLRRARYDVVVDCGNWTEPSVSSAILSRLAGAFGAVIGPSTPSVERLRSHPVAPRADTGNEVLQRLNLLSPLMAHPQGKMSFRRPLPGGEVKAFIESLGTGESRRVVVINPGGRLGWRRVPEAVFAWAARSAASLGFVPVVTWGPGEEALADAVCQLAPGAVRAPSTSLDDLAWLMQESQLTVSNNTGPMHLSVAVGTPTLGLFLFMDKERWGHTAAPHQMLDLTPHVSEPEKMGEHVGEEVLRMLQRAQALQKERP